MRSGAMPPQKNLSSSRTKQCILNRRARPKEGFLGYGTVKAVGSVTLKSLPYLSFPNEVLSEWQGRGIPRRRSRVRASLCIVELSLPKKMFQAVGPSGVY